MLALPLDPPYGVEPLDAPPLLDALYALDPPDAPLLLDPPNGLEPLDAPLDDGSEVPGPVPAGLSDPLSHATAMTSPTARAAIEVTLRVMDKSLLRKSSWGTASCHVGAYH